MFLQTRSECWCGSGKSFACCHGADEALVKKGNVSPKRSVPQGIICPDYVKTGRPVKSLPEMHQVSCEELNRIRTSGHFARSILKQLIPMVKAGVTTEDIDSFAHQLIIAGGAYPSPLNYGHFPKSICTSVNEIICHGIPDDRPLKNGDIVNLDITVYFNGAHGDCSEMVLVGDVDPVSVKLVRDTWECMRRGIEVVKPGVKVSEIGRVIENYAKECNWSVVRAYCGHGIGEVFHTGLQIAHYYEKHVQTRLKPGMVFTIEPMINMGTWKHRVWPDQWTAVTQDRKRSAQFEHMLVCTETGYEILTLLPGEELICPV